MKLGIQGRMCVSSHKHLTPGHRILPLAQTDQGFCVGQPCILTRESIPHTYRTYAPQCHHQTSPLHLTPQAIPSLRLCACCPPTTTQPHAIPSSPRRKQTKAWTARTPPPLTHTIFSTRSHHHLFLPLPLPILLPHPRPYHRGPGASRPRLGPPPTSTPSPTASAPPS